MLSSRKAERIIRKKTAPTTNYNSLKEKLAELEKGEPSRTLLFTSGMGAISNVILGCQTPRRSKIIMLGSPYVDTRCILEKWPERRGTPETIFLEIDDLARLEQSVDGSTALVVCEIPTNPLLRVPDLAQVVRLAHRQGTRVLVDNTIASPYNLTPFDYEVDYIAHSTTKSLNGMNDHLGGALLARTSRLFKPMQQFYSLLQLSMDPADAAVLNRNLDSFTSRMETMNQNTLAVAKYLADHPKVKRVHYPGLRSHPDYKMACRYLKGFGSLLSFELAGDMEKNTQLFYDNLGAPLKKAPSLGAAQSLICLYTILAHYCDPPEKLARMGLIKYLLRISVGTEPLQDILQAFEHGFSFIEE